MERGEIPVMALIKAKDMIQEQVTHTFCSFCNYRLLVAGETHWGCTLEQKKIEELSFIRVITQGLNRFWI